LYFSPHCKITIDIIAISNLVVITNRNYNQTLIEKQNNQDTQQARLTSTVITTNLSVGHQPVSYSF
jgi:hypothetical protein